MPLVFSITDHIYCVDETGCAGRRYPTQAAVARCFLQLKQSAAALLSRFKQPLPEILRGY